MIKVYGRSGSSNSAKVFWLLVELGLPYELVETGGKHGGNDTPEFRAMNPFGKVPVLVDETGSFWESNAILRYLASQQAETDLWPTSPSARAIVDGWMDWASLSLAAPLTRLRKARAAGKGDGDLPAVIAAFTQLDAQLARMSFIAGHTLTLADITAAPSVHRWFLLDGNRPSLPHLEAYHQSLCKIEGYQIHIGVPLS
jgi:glutathione S-transferase